MIESNKISVVIQGAVQRETTDLLRSIRRFLPEAEIILSTWKNSNVVGFAVDQIVFNQDPGAISGCIDTSRKFNLNRQIISSTAGVEAATRPFILKCRSDMELLGTGFLDFWEEYPERDHRYTLAEHKIIVPALYTIKGEFSEVEGRLHPTPYHISDWYAFGLKEDILQFCSAPLVENKPFSRYFVYHKKPREYNIVWLNERTWRYSPEQYFGVCYAKKWRNDIDFPNCLDYDRVDFEAAERFLVNNFIVVEPADGQIALNKKGYYDMSRDLRFCPEHIRDTVYRRYVYESDYKKYCDPEFEPKGDAWPETESGRLFQDAMLEQYEKAKQRPVPDEYDFGIITPTYAPHFHFISNYLKSFDQFVLDKERVPIYFTVGANEFFEFSKIIAPYTKRLRIHVFVFENLLEYFQIKEDPELLLRKYGRFSFQTLKKFYTMLYAGKEKYLVLDSESMWSAPTSMREEIERFFEKPFVPYSPVLLQREGVLAQLAVENVGHILNTSVNKWCLECFCWFYETKFLRELFGIAGSPIKIVKKTYAFEQKKHRNVGVFEILLYTAFLEAYHSDRYTFIDIYSEIRNALSKDEFERYSSRVWGLFNGEGGFAEHMSLLLTPENCGPLAKVYRKHNFIAIRCETNSKENFILEKRFLGEAGVKILAASQDHWLAKEPEREMSPVIHALKNRRDRIAELIIRCKIFLKKIMRAILPAYRAAHGTREILLEHERAEELRFRELMQRQNAVEEALRK